MSYSEDDDDKNIKFIDSDDEYERSERPQDDDEKFEFFDNDERSERPQDDDEDDERSERPQDDDESTDIEEQLCPCCGFFNSIEKKFCDECDFDLSKVAKATLLEWDP